MRTFLLPSAVYEFFSSVLRLTLEVVPVILTLERSWAHRSGITAPLPPSPPLPPGADMNSGSARLSWGSADHSSGHCPAEPPHPMRTHPNWQRHSSTGALVYERDFFFVVFSFQVHNRRLELVKQSTKKFSRFVFAHGGKYSVWKNLSMSRAFVTVNCIYGAKTLLY